MAGPGHDPPRQHDRPRADLLNSHPGTKYGIPFPVFARASYGTLGSNLPALMRAIVACGWFGIQSWIGGEALYTFFATLIPSFHGLLGQGPGGHTNTEWLSFLLFWGLNVFIIYRGMDLLRKVENWAAPFVLVMAAVLLVWAVRQAHGFGPLLAQRGKFSTLAEFLPVFIPSLTAMIGYWATLSLNMPDFTRFGRSQREQIVGQVVALPTTMSVFAAMGVMITSATVLIYGQAIWDPVQLVGKFKAPIVVAISMFTAVVATLAVNIAANVVSPANDFSNAFPRWIRFKTGGLITGILGILMQPWRLLSDASGYIFTWLLGYSGLGSIAGVLIATTLGRRSAEARGPLPHSWCVPLRQRLELESGVRDACRLRARVGRPRRAAPEAPLLLRLVRRVLRLRRALLGTELGERARRDRAGRHRSAVRVLAAVRLHPGPLPVGEGVGAGGFWAAAPFS